MNNCARGFAAAIAAASTLLVARPAGAEPTDMAQLLEATASEAEPSNPTEALEEMALEAEPFDTAHALDEAALKAERGGFTFQGMQISLGAELRTFIGGQLALHSTVSWNAQGASKTETIHGALTPAGADQLRAGILTSGAITMSVGDSRVYLANQGQTAFIQRTDGSLQNILVNTASNVALRQEVEVTLGLAGYAGFAQDNALGRLGGAISDALSRATLGTLGH